MLRLSDTERRVLRRGISSLRRALDLRGLEDKAANFKESEHPRGQPGNAGQFSSSSGGGGSASEKDPATRKDIRGDISAAYGMTLQPTDNLDDLYERAKKAEPRFKSDVEEIAKGTGGEVMYTPAEYAEPGTILKSKSSAERKLTSELGGEVNQLKDVIRATVVHLRYDQTRAAAVDFIKAHRDRILRVKDRIVKPVGGYRDILINYQTADGLVAEVQFNTSKMVEAKNGEGHKFYEQIRGAKQVSAVEDIERKQRAFYDEAYQASGNGNWSEAAT